MSFLFTIITALFSLIFRKSEKVRMVILCHVSWISGIRPNPTLLPKIKVPPHEDSIVYRLVDAAVEILCGQANEDTLDLYKTPSYLLDDDSRKRYRQVSP